MSLQELSEEDLAERESALLKAVEDAGGSIGNTSLMRALGWNDDDYWPVRERLVYAGRLERARGKGGSVRLVQAASTTPSAGPPAAAVPAPSAGAPLVPGDPPTAVLPPRLKEQELYEPVAKVLRTTWAKEQSFREVVAEVTAKQGKRDTGGRWTRPDVTVASMTTLLFVPGKFFDVATFELKPSDAIDVVSVYEALAHRRAATRSYVWLHLSDEQVETPEMIEALEAIRTEAKRYGIGVIVAADP
jgi:hypothetical protein